MNRLINEVKFLNINHVKFYSFLLVTGYVVIKITGLIYNLKNIIWKEIKWIVLNF